MDKLSMAQLSSLVKRANQRLRELEKQGYTKERAYERAEYLASTDRKFMSKTAKGEIKFRTDLKRLYKEDRKQYYQLKDQVNTFLAYQTSLAGKVKKKYEKATKTFKKKYGIDLTPMQQKEIFGSEQYKQLEYQLGSDVAITVIQNEDNQTVEHIKKVMEDLAEERVMLGDYEDMVKSKPQRKRGF